MDELATKRVVQRLIVGEDYRVEVFNLINGEFLDFSMQFFKKVVEAKMNSEIIGQDWYKKYFLDEKLPKNEVAINSGLNMKSITNTYGTGKKETVINVSKLHYDQLIEVIEELTTLDENLDLNLTITYNKVSVELTLSETLVVVNTLAVKRAAIRGGAWSSVGKKVEKPLMLALCSLFEVPSTNYSVTFKRAKKNEKVKREVDFYLLKDSKEYACEVKLMGKGNPESADQVFARSSDIIVADTLSDANKRQLDEWKVLWVELKSSDFMSRFEDVLKKLSIPYTSPKGKYDFSEEEINRAIDKAFEILRIQSI